ncbi:MAG: rubredoxin [Desulfitibacter sp. BRH_c19]|nr:MAG: rubredoxin [Desulfitibacter sp. BRH_c19]
MWKCSVCNYIYEGGDAPERCPKCGSPKEKYIKLEDAAEQKISGSRETNQLLMVSIELLEELEAIGERGVEINLDPGCQRYFTKLKEQAKSLKQNSLAEIETHVKKDKWS